MADEPYRLKIKIGANEFEAEGPKDEVRQQFEMFKEMLSTAPAPIPVAKPNDGELWPGHVPPLAAAALDASLANIMNVEGRIVSLTALPDSADESVLLILYGQKILRANDASTGSEIIDGLEASGPAPSRIDRIIERAVDAGDVMSHGTGRAKRYRLTNMGMSKARAIATALIAKIS